MAADLDALARLRSFATPTIANALEALGGDPVSDFTDASLRLLTEGLPAFVGRAVTARMVSASAPTGGPTDSPHVPTENYWRHVAAHAPPSVVVVEDMDLHPVGAMWGEVQGRLHRSLGVVGIITNGAARDITELVEIGLPVIGGRVCVSHARARFIELDVPVQVGGLEVRPGDLLHADRHGVQRIPAGVSLDLLVDAAERIESLEAELFAAADGAISLESFISTWVLVRSRWPRPATHSGDAI